MEYQLEKVTLDKKDVLYNLLQFALYDGSQFIENELNEKGNFNYTWFDNYFTDANRKSYFIKNDYKYIGFVMINENLKFNNSGKSVAEFLIMPQYRRNHIGKKVAMEIFNMYPGWWEVEPIENSESAYNFWKKTIEEYTSNDFEIKDEKIFIFNK